MIGNLRGKCLEARELWTAQTVSMHCLFKKCWGFRSIILLDPITNYLILLGYLALEQTEGGGEGAHPHPTYLKSSPVNVEMAKTKVDSHIHYSAPCARSYKSIHCHKGNRLSAI